MYSDKYYINSFDNNQLSISIEQENEINNKQKENNSFLHN